MLFCRSPFEATIFNRWGDGVKAGIGKLFNCDGRLRHFLRGVGEASIVGSLKVSWRLCFDGADIPWICGGAHSSIPKPRQRLSGQSKTWRNYGVAWADLRRSRLQNLNPEVVVPVFHQNTNDFEVLILDTGVLAVPAWGFLVGRK